MMPPEGGVVRRGHIRHLKFHQDQHIHGPVPYREEHTEMDYVPSDNFQDTNDGI